ncbi:fimbrial protein [Burkholderia seminalis]|uniref:fimbrial protein n=1 Tax=Burkholderia seminalis TaxID=488731 RepID=UPI001CF1FCFF|nr:fimbrial protein [Burkholderia seminalis]MCA8302903.1 fimbrial protein [Burkholderia seminalis]
MAKGLVTFVVAIQDRMEMWMIIRNKVFIALCLALAPVCASAACQADTTDGKDYYVVSVSGFNPPPFDPTQTYVGGVIYTAEATVMQFTNVKGFLPFTSCSSATREVYTGIGAQGNNNVYPTDIPNIGIRVRSPMGQPYPFITNGTGWTNKTWELIFAPKIFELVKTGDITAGGILTGAYARYTADSAAGQTLVEFRFASPLIIKPRVPSCTVQSPSNIPVSMGRVMATSAFSGVGSTAPPQSFSIKLQCSGGAAGTRTRAFVTLTDATNAANTSKTLSLSKSAKAATGVGIQILKDDVVLGYGPDSSAVGNTNQWYAGTVKQGQDGMSIDLKARYVQISPRITPGSANAAATFTLSYQ